MQDQVLLAPAWGTEARDTAQLCRQPSSWGTLTSNYTPFHAEHVPRVGGMRGSEPDCWCHWRLHRSRCVRGMHHVCPCGHVLHTSAHRSPALPVLDGLCRGSLMHAARVWLPPVA